MFHSFGYRGHTIHIAVQERTCVSTIEVQLHKPNGGLDLVPCKTLLGAKRRITRHVRLQTNSQPDEVCGGTD